MLKFCSNTTTTRHCSSFSLRYNSNLTFTRPPSSTRPLAMSLCRDCTCEVLESTNSVSEWIDTYVARVVDDGASLCGCEGVFCTKTTTGDDSSSFVTSLVVTERSSGFISNRICELGNGNGSASGSGSGSDQPIELKIFGNQLTGTLPECMGQLSEVLSM